MRKKLNTSSWLYHWWMESSPLTNFFLKLISIFLFQIESLVLSIPQQKWKLYWSTYIGWYLRTSFGRVRGNRSQITDFTRHVRTLFWPTIWWKYHLIWVPWAELAISLMDVVHSPALLFGKYAFSTIKCSEFPYFSFCIIYYILSLYLLSEFSTN